MTELGFMIGAKAPALAALLLVITVVVGDQVRGHIARRLA